MTAARRTCIIGAGSSRITAVKALHDHGLPFDCYEYFNPEAIAAKDNDLPLFMRVFKPDIPNLCFIGFVQPWGAIMPVAEAQNPVGVG